MSDLLSLVLSSKHAAKGHPAGIDDVRIKFAPSNVWRALKRHGLIEIKQRKSAVPSGLRTGVFADFLVAMVEIKSAHVVINLLLAPEDPVRSQHLLMHGAVLAKGRKNTSAFISALLQGPSGNPWLFTTDDKISAMSDDNSHEFFIVGDPNAGANEAKNGRQVISRAEELIGDREKAEVWFQYHPLPAFENKTPRQLVGEGRSDAVLLHLDTLEDGAYA